MIMHHTEDTTIEQTVTETPESPSGKFMRDNNSG
jgi:hypothetical protein